ncbi:DsbA family oxidoreductase [Paramicrobacterium agarici]|uniref:DsbA family oxidoreductase n=1 Tax=Paramicrobacterium agarici TaxID=630514 RepID=UPI001151FF90|nr:DsbA family oxidoreductase [Microbacterium agarici]TQO24327.1 putative DsbA family dithiol-disulfide isomerase [Microbacterium agarici]
MSEPITVDIWSDIACPWCYIGKRRFERGLESFSSDAGNPPVSVRFHSFELAPDTPIDFEGSEEEFLASYKGMPADQVTQMLDHVARVANETGLDYDFGSVKHTKTLKAHELVHFARAQGREHDVVERLMRAYFVEGRHVGRVGDLADLAGDVGLDRDAAAHALEQGTYAADVEKDKAKAAEYGINGVPFFVFDGQYGVSGAQEPETFNTVLREVVTRRGAQS